MRGRSPLASSSPVGLSTGVSSPARMSRPPGTASRRSVVTRALAYLARFALLVGVALVLWTAVGQAVAPTAPRVRLPCKRKSPGLSWVRVGIP